MLRPMPFVPLPAVAALLILSSPGIGAATLLVPSQYPTIQAAVDVARSGDHVLVAAGTYFENLEIHGKSISLASESGPRDTIIDGRAQGSVMRIGEGNSDDTVSVSGFTLRNGAATDGAGGGIRQLGGTMIIEGNEIVGNHAALVGGACSGGGIHVFGGATIRHNRIAGNESEFDGGGIYVHGSTPTPPIVIADNVIEDNIASVVDFRGVGGGVYVRVSAAVVRNVIRNNTTNWYGAGVAVKIGPFTPVYVADNLIHGNESDYNGGVYAIIERPGGSGGQFVNNTIADNQGYFGQILTGWYASGFTFANNVVVSTDGSVAVTCDKYFDKTSPIFKHNDVYAGDLKPAAGSCKHDATHGSNMHVDPRFTTGANGHPYHLAPTSPLIDAGMNRFVKRVHHDLGGRPRIIDGGRGPIVDIGAFEYRPE